MIENRDYISPTYTRDNQGRYRTWPTFAGPEPEDILPGWAHDVDDEPLPRLVEPAPLQDPMVEVER